VVFAPDIAARHDGDGVALALIFAHQHGAGLEAPVRQLAAPREAERVLCASPDYLDRHGIPTHPNDLRYHNCLTYGYLSTGNQWKLTGVYGDHWIAPKWTLCANNAEVLRDVAARGCGIAVVPVFIAQKELKNGTSSMNYYKER